MSCQRKSVVLLLSWFNGVHSVCGNRYDGCCLSLHHHRRWTSGWHFKVVVEQLVGRKACKLQRLKRNQRRYIWQVGYCCGCIQLGCLCIIPLIDTNIIILLLLTPVYYTDAIVAMRRSWSRSLSVLLNNATVSYWYVCMYDVYCKIQNI